jgi:hypothetical protein
VYQEERPEITAALEKYGYGRGEVAEILKRIGKACYPRQYAKVGKFLIEPPPIATLFNAWKETNIGAEKDLDTSVFWRAVLALDSCVTSLRARRVQAFLEELEATVAAPETTPAKKLDSLDFVYRHYSERLWIYHPVVVTDARLWSSTTVGLKEVSEARFVRSDGIFETNRWFDLVSREHFDGYIRAVTAHYEKRFRAVRSTSVRI